MADSPGENLPRTQTVVSISTRVSCEPDAGHFFWMYKDLSEAQTKVGSGVTTIGPRSEKCGHIFPIISVGAQAGEFRLTPTTLTRYPLRTLLNAVESMAQVGPRPVLQFYDGGLQELIVALRLAREFPDHTVIYNFHWAIQWLEVIESRGVSGVAFRTALRNALLNPGRNVRLSAESGKLAQHLRARLGIDCETYPVFSGLNSTGDSPWDRRDRDVLMMPQRSSEIPFVLALTRALRARGVSVLVLTRESTWNRGLEFSRIANVPGIDNLPPVLFTPLSLNDYSRLIEKSRVSLLPYDKPYFEWGSSGKFNESILLGCFPFVPDSTAIGSQSTLPEQLHHFNFADIEGTVDRVISRLDQGFPEDLTGVSVDDFLAWARANPASQTTVAPQVSAQNITLLLTTSVFLSWKRAMWASQPARLVRNSVRFATRLLGAVKPILLTRQRK